MALRAGLIHLISSDLPDGASRRNAPQLKSPICHLQSRAG
jgi:hypothetical protein